jgi:diphthamide biosynthesis methyltransferase
MEEKINGNIFKQDSILCVVARAGADEPVVAAGNIKELIDRDFGPPLHTIVVPGKLHFMEFEALKVLAQLPA